MRALGTRVGYVALAVVVLVVLLVGSHHPVAPTAAQRIAYLESVIKCPSCTDLTIAQSGTPQAVALRQEVTQGVDQGRSDAQIEHEVVTQYNGSEILAPTATTRWAWIVPIVAAVIAVGALGVTFWRRRRRPRTGTGTDADHELVAEALVARRTAP